MRKYLVAALAATAAIGVGTAVAQEAPQTASMKVTVSPKKAGTAKKPVNSSIGLTITNDNPRAVLTKLAVHIPKTLKTSGAGFPACKKSKLDNPTLDSKGRPTACKSSRVGSGTAKALGGINTSASFPVEFKVTAIVGGKSNIWFFLHGTNVAVNVVAPGKLTNKGKLLTVKVPSEAQNIASLWNGLVQLKTTLKGKSGKHFLIGSTGCKSKKHKFSTDLTFGRTFASTDGGVTYTEGPGYKTTVKAAAACR